MVAVCTPSSAVGASTEQSGRQGQAASTSEDTEARSSGASSSKETAVRLDHIHHEVCQQTVDLCTWIGNVMFTVLPRHEARSLYCFPCCYTVIFPLTCLKC